MNIIRKAQKKTELKNMQICLALIIIKSCSYELIIPNLIEILDMTSKQVIMTLEYLLEKGFIVVDSEDNFFLKISTAGYSLLRDNNISNISLKDLLEAEDQDVFLYKSKILTYIPNNYESEV